MTSHDQIVFRKNMIIGAARTGSALILALVCCILKTRGAPMWYLAIGLVPACILQVLALGNIIKCARTLKSVS